MATRIAPFGDARDLLPEYLRPRDPSLDVVDALRDVKAAIEANAAQPKQEPSSSERLKTDAAAQDATVEDGALTLEQAAKLLTLSTRTVSKLVKDGRLAARRTAGNTGRFLFRRDNIDAFLAGTTKPLQPQDTLRVNQILEGLKGDQDGPDVGKVAPVKSRRRGASK